MLFSKIKNWTLTKLEFYAERLVDFLDTTKGQMVKRLVGVFILIVVLTLLVHLIYRITHIC